MAARLTTRAQVNGHRFLLRRLEHALIRRDARMIHDPMRSQVRAMLVGFVICVLVMAACGALAIFKPAPRLGNSLIVTSKSSGAMFVRLNDELHPVLNLASARLIAGKPEEPSNVKDKDLRSMPMGPTLGIIGGPTAINKADDLSRSDWSVCDIWSSSEGSGGKTTGQTVVMASKPVLTPDIRVADKSAAAVARSSDGVFYLLYEGKRAPIDISDPVIRNALKIDENSMLNASEGLLQSFKMLAPIERIEIPEAGQPSQLPLPQSAPIGSIVRASESSGVRQYVVLANSLTQVSDVTADIIRFSNPQLKGDAMEISPASLNSLLVESSLPVDTSDYPSTLLEYSLASSSAVCTHWFGPSLSQSPEVEILMGDRLPIPENSRPTTLISDDGSGPQADAAYIPVGTGEFIQAAGQNRVAGQLFYVSDTGMRFPIPDPETADKLGVHGVRSADGKKSLPQLAPWNVVSLLPAGPALTTGAALIAHGGFPGDSEGVPTSPAKQGASAGS